MRVEVTLSDIKTCRAGKFKGGMYQCPIELAAQRAFKQDAMGLGVGTLLVGGWNGIFYTLPAEAQQFAIDYEAGAKVQPLTFETLPVGARFE